LVAGAGGSLGGPLCVSTNSGATWHVCKVTPQEWCAVASSWDGQRLLAGFQFGGAIGHFYTSADYGSSWTWLNLPTNASRSWDSPVIAASADGQKFAIGFTSVDSDAPVLVYHWPPPTLNIGLTNVPATRQPAVILSWQGWATNYGLQFNRDLGGVNWEAVTNPPTLVYDQSGQSGVCHVVLPLTNVNGYYRLAAP
jgi:hypothetical protein